MIKIDTSAIEALAAEVMAKATRGAAQEARQVVAKGALNVKKAWRANATATAGAHGKHYPKSIDYDLTASGNTIEAEIGPNSAMPQGGMGRGFEYGSANQPPHGDMARAVTAEEPRFFSAVEALRDRLAEL